MKITIFGASSATGKLLVEKALAQGHTVAAFVRDASNLSASDDHLKIITGDARNPADVDTAIQGADAVLSTIGPKGKQTTVAAESTQNIAAAMNKHGVERLVLVSVGGISVAPDQRSGLGKLIGKLLKILLGPIFTDRERQLEILQSSGLDWVAVRVPRLLDGPATGKVFAGYWGQKGVGSSLTRADLADFMLAQLNEDTWLGKAPVVTNSK
mgnify:CR=1 FL=1